MADAILPLEVNCSNNRQNSNVAYVRLLHAADLTFPVMDMQIGRNTHPNFLGVYSTSDEIDVERLATEALERYAYTNNFSN